jgi:hypothetical protein
MKLISMTEKQYMRIHDFVRRNKPKNKTCEHCGLEKKLDNALITGKTHDKNVDNYIQLCRSCHNKYGYPDGKKHSEESILKIGIASSKRIEKNGVNANFINARKGATATEETKLLMSIKAKKRWELHRANKK